MEITGLKVGLEIHQQLATGRKLFCGCGKTGRGGAKTFTRRLRVSESETGEYDPAAVFEGSRSRSTRYHAPAGSSCLVEEDEEPPHEIDPEAKRAALLVAAALGSKVFEVLFVMRKIVIDGSNTSGFQRTILVSQGGALKVGRAEVGVQSICLEEDAARPVSGGSGAREYNLDRLGVPLIEIALAPAESGPREVKETALALGRLLRTTGIVSRGIGTIRQDVNVSLRGGSVVEIKGLQQLDQLERTIEYEAKRQDGLCMIARRIGGAEIRGGVHDISDVLRGCRSDIIRGGLEGGLAVRAVLLRGLAGVLGYEPYPGVRLGREIAQVVRSFGVGGVFHSDELPAYGIGDSDVAAVRERLQASRDDAFLIVAADHSRADAITGMILGRMRQARIGVPAETRQATPGGETVFLRPKPGSARMYPETDIEPMPVTPEEMLRAESDVPMTWDEQLADLTGRHGINRQLAAQILDSQYLDIFEKASSMSVPPNFVASTLCSTMTELRRRGLDSEPDPREILYMFGQLSRGSIPKESVGLILEDMMSGRSGTAREAIGKIGTVGPERLDEILLGIAEENRDLIRRQGARAMGSLMGAAMKRLRGKAAGSAVNSRLSQIISDMSKEEDR